MAAYRLAMVSDALAAGRPARDDEQDAVRLARSVELLAGLGGRAAIVIGSLLLVLVAVDGGNSRSTALALGIGVGAALFGLVLIRMPSVVPVFAMDMVMIGADGMLVLLAHLHSFVLAAMPGVYLVMGSITLAMRRWQVATLHGVLLAASYAGVLVVGPHDRFAPAKWTIMITCIVGAGVFVRWLVASVTALAASERAARNLAERAGEDLEQVSAAKTAFLAHMSHELRTPLNVVLGFADLLAERRAGPLNERQEGYLDDVRTSARHLVELVDEVFDLTRADTGGMHVTPSLVDVASLLEDALALVRGQFDARSVSASLELEPDLPELEADRLKIRQVVVNLLVNAAKFTPPGGRVVLAAHASARFVTVRVMDTGVGISPEDQERIFEEYAQSGSPAEGTGLGLPLARRLVELHGGTLELTQTSPAGSTFSFTLPTTRSGRVDIPTVGIALPAVSDRFAAFGQPGSAANRTLLGKIGCVFAINGSVVTAIVAGFWPPSQHERVWGLAGAALTFVLALAGYRRVGRRPVRHVSPFLWVVTGFTTAVTYVGGPYIGLLPLTYGFVTIIGFTFLSRRSALTHLVGIAVCYGAILILRMPPHGLESWLSLMALLGFNGGVVSWMNQQLRALAVAEHKAHYAAEEVVLEVAATSRHKSAFVANMSHELRTPLNAVIGFTELLDGELVGPLNERQREYLHEVRSAARHLLSIINDVLDMAKLDAGQLTIAPEQTAVRPMVENAIAHATAGPPRQLSVETDFAEGTDYVIADPVRMEQVVRHLVSNAVRFTPDGGTVTVSVQRAAEGELHIAVSDTGVGIAPEQRAHLFDAFTPGPTLPGQVRTGTGTGLALARGLVAVHGGRIWLTSRAGFGSTFTIALPNQSQASAPLAESTS